jgi:hypothetical protein
MAQSECSKLQLIAGRANVRSLSRLSIDTNYAQSAKSAAIVRFRRVSIAGRVNEIVKAMGFDLLGQISKTDVASRSSM